MVSYSSSMKWPQQAVLLLLLGCCIFQSTLAWTTSTPTSSRRTAALKMYPEPEPVISDISTRSSSRRSVFVQSASVAATLFATILGSNPSLASAEAGTSSTADAQITDRIFLEVKGLGGPTAPPQRIIIGLFGKDAPQSTKMLKQLVSRGGLPATCKPKSERTLQKEQMEANKVYSTCQEQQDKGVNYEYSQIWRIVPDVRVDVGSVSGRFIAREFPTWQETADIGLQHDAMGVVSVRKGNDSGFGFTIYAGTGGDDDATKKLDEDHIVVGRVENLDIVSALNAVPVITSSKLGGNAAAAAMTQTAPNRSCTYGGGQLYCNEYKPLNKLSTLSAGVL